MPSGWKAEQTSWRNPGRVNSSVRVPPPMVSLASSTTTRNPCSATATAAAKPLGPDPTTTASQRAILSGRPRPLPPMAQWSPEPIGEPGNRGPRR